ncbi:hypothetical protein PACTADRAFT_33150 [Pachysolen tannophilus NRRL Y-2460]|uniref:NADP-dependent oxidoreductase domain-containing protein n=1 Tax=Pachysolen tannophilus NRRL Y-2460 TaxID=669874 RepID=A0A1E4TW41_PACTA|nr:hypothetical protein PACTADRAFT_33150 [Pachysolen tannophilus NRRL Y-2460]
MTIDESIIKPIGASGVPVKGDLSDISELIMGGAVFNTQYNNDPEAMDIDHMLLYAFNLGINALDTSPYYGPSEVLLGKSLNKLILNGEIHREHFYICTKVGRIQLDEFEYSPEWINKSVANSLERLHTSYIDLLHLHDIEFVEEDKIIVALREMRKLKDKGLIKNFGISGYPVEFLYKIALACVDDPLIGSLDSVLSYSNMCLQNTKLLHYYDKFMNNANLKKLNNGSILSMSLLRSQGTKSFHPCSPELNQKCKELAVYLKEKYNMELADVATRFAIQNWSGKQGSTVLGASTLYELKDALAQYWKVKNKTFEEDTKIFQEAQEFLGSHFGEVWESGIKH